MPRIRRLGALALVALACSPAQPSSETATLRGAVELPSTLRGNAYVFLFNRAEGPPSVPAEPRFATAVSEVRLSRGDGSFVFPDVPPGAYRLWGFLDVDLDFRSDVDLLAQPLAHDRPSQGLELELAAGQVEAPEVRWLPPLRHHPPAFRVTRPVGDLVTFVDLPLVPQVVELTADDLGLLTGEPPGFAVRLADANGDGVADDANGDGIPDLWPRVFLRFVPRPGQTVPAEQVIVPVAFNPLPFLATLGSDVESEVLAEQLLGFVVPQAQAVSVEGGQARTAPLDAIPVGDYELVVVEPTGQLWRVPNALGGGLPSQVVRFRIVHGTGLGGSG